MFIVGQSLDSVSLYSIYAVFENNQNLENWVLNYEKIKLDNVKIIEIKSVVYPFFILEYDINAKSHYQYIDKIEFSNKLLELELLGDYKTIYFNLWRIEKDTFNKNFPTEQCLNGMNYHLHFRDYDIQQIIANGLDKYWNEILIA